MLCITNIEHYPAKISLFWSGVISWGSPSSKRNLDEICRVRSRWQLPILAEGPRVRPEDVAHQKRQGDQGNGRPVGWGRPGAKPPRNLRHRLTLQNGSGNEGTKRWGIIEPRRLVVRLFLIGGLSVYLHSREKNINWDVQTIIKSQA